MDYDALKDPEFQEKLKGAKTAQELAELVRTQGIDLSDEDLQAISGGSDWYDASEWGDCESDDCPSYGSILAC